MRVKFAAPPPPPPVTRPVLHIVVVAPDEKWLPLLRRSMYIVAPQLDGHEYDFATHLFIGDPNADADPAVMMAALEMDLDDPSQVKFTRADQMTLGWADHRKDRT
jgi:hypothetical protein